MATNSSFGINENFHNCRGHIHVNNSVREFTSFSEQYSARQSIQQGGVTWTGFKTAPMISMIGRNPDGDKVM